MQHLPRAIGKKSGQNTGFIFASLLLVTGCFGVFQLVHHPASAQSQTNPTPTNTPISATSTPASCLDKLGNTRKVGVQVGHLQTDQLPDELANLHWDFGTSSNGVNEIDVNRDIAQKVVAILQKNGISTDVLPATVPPDYCASAFVAIHADGNDDTSVYGYKVSPSIWDTDGKAALLSNDIVQDFESATQMYQNPTITEDMTNYYAFNYQKYSHSIDQQTPGVIVEVGFITNDTDRWQMVNNSANMADGIANGIIDYLNGNVINQN